MLPLCSSGSLDSVNGEQADAPVEPGSQHQLAVSVELHAPAGGGGVRWRQGQQRSGSRPVEAGRGENRRAGCVLT